MIDDDTAPAYPWRVSREGEIVGERFRLERQLGSGAMGAVWLARHLTLGNPMAVKIIRAEAALNPQARARFEREAVLAARIRSAHVVTVVDHGLHDDLPYIVMEYLEGQSLRERLDSRGRLGLVETAMIVRHVARALVVAHEIGLVHRDIKPENLFIVSVDGDEVVKVLDFGVAKVSDEIMLDGVDPTRTGALLGTPFYLSPEQARGLRTLDHRADLWSLGVVAFECLTGRRPFAAHAMGPLIAKITVGPIPLPSQLAPELRLPLDVDRWMSQALCRDPIGRFASAMEMADAFGVATGVLDSIPTDRDGPAPDLDTLGAARPDGPRGSLAHTHTAIISSSQVAATEKESGLASTVALPESASLGGTVALPGGPASSLSPAAPEIPGDSSALDDPHGSTPSAASPAELEAPSGSHRRLVALAAVVALASVAAALWWTLLR